MAAERSSTSGSILAADFGNVLTRAVLIDMVDGVYRLVARAEARSTANFPIGDARVALLRAADELNAVTGRAFFDEHERLITPERPDRSGVDVFVATASTGRSLRTVLVGLVPEVSIASARRAAAGTYVDVVETISLDDGRDEEARLNALVNAHPDLVFITGGTEGGAAEPLLELAEVVRLGVRLLGERQPLILYAGNSALIPQMQARFKGVAHLVVAPNIRPSLEREELEAAQLQLGQAFDQQQARKGGFGELGSISRLGVLPTGQSYKLITEYLALSLSSDVLTVDVGSAVSTLAASVNGRVTTVIRPDIGLGHSADSLRDLAGEAAIRRWLPFVPAPGQIRSYTLNKTLRPGSIPETLQDLYLEHALLRAAIDTLLRAARPGWSASVMQVNTPLPPFKLIIGAGAGLTRAGNPGYGALLLLDALQPVGAALLQTDPYGLVAALGALAHLNPEAVVQVLDGSGIERLGAAISVSGRPAANRAALKVKITTESGEVIRHDVPGGHLWVYPLGVGKHVKVDARAVGRGLSIGGRRRWRGEVEGGSVGIIFDARGRPLPLAADARGLAAQLPQWIAEVTGDPPAAIDESWLALPEIKQEDEPAAKRRRRSAKPAAPKVPAVRRGLFGRRGKAAEPMDDIDLPDMDLDDEPQGRRKDEDFIDELDQLRRG